MGNGNHIQTRHHYHCRAPSYVLVTRSVLFSNGDNHGFVELLAEEREGGDQRNEKPHFDYCDSQRYVICQFCYSNDLRFVYLVE